MCMTSYILSNKTLFLTNQYFQCSRSHTIHKKEAVCLKSSNDTLENYIFCEYVKFVVISLKKNDILSITA